MKARVNVLEIFRLNIKKLICTLSHNTATSFYKFSTIFRFSEVVIKSEIGKEK